MEQQHLNKHFMALKCLYTTQDLLLFPFLSLTSTA